MSVVILLHRPNELPTLSFLRPEYLEEAARTLGGDLERRLLEPGVELWCNHKEQTSGTYFIIRLTKDGSPTHLTAWDLKRYL